MLLCCVSAAGRVQPAAAALPRRKSAFVQKKKWSDVGFDSNTVRLLSGCGRIPFLSVCVCPSFGISLSQKDTEQEDDVGLSHKLGLAAAMDVAL